MPEKPAQDLPILDLEDGDSILEQIHAKQQSFSSEGINHQSSSRPAARHEERQLSFSSILIFLRRVLGLRNGERWEDQKKSKGYLMWPAKEQVSSPQNASNVIGDIEKIHTHELNYLYNKTVNIYHAVYTLSVGKFTPSFLGVLLTDLDSTIEGLNSLLQPNDSNFTAILDGLKFARSKLGFAAALFEFEEFREIDPLYRLVLRNKTFPILIDILERVLVNWPLSDSYFQSGQVFAKLAGDSTTDAPPPDKKKKPKGK